MAFIWSRYKNDEVQLGLNLAGLICVRPTLGDCFSPIRYNKGLFDFFAVTFYMFGEFQERLKTTLTAMLANPISHYSSYFMHCITGITISKKRQKPEIPKPIFSFIFLLIFQIFETQSPLP